MLSHLLSYILSLCSLPWIKSVFISFFHLFQQILIPMESAHSFWDSCKACPKLLLCALKNFVLALLTDQLFVQWHSCSLGKLPLFFILLYLPLQTERMQPSHCPWCLHYETLTFFRWFLLFPVLLSTMLPVTKKMFSQCDSCCCIYSLSVPPSPFLKWAFLNWVGVGYCQMCKPAIWTVHHRRPVKMSVLKNVYCNSK